MQISTGLPPLAQRRACIDSRMLSTTVASPCQTLRELYTSPSISDTAHAQFAEGLHFTVNGILDCITYHLRERGHGYIISYNTAKSRRAHLVAKRLFLSNDSGSTVSASSLLNFVVLHGVVCSISFSEAIKPAPVVLELFIMVA